jgi:hypothetical protein
MTRKPDPHNFEELNLFWLATIFYSLLPLSYSHLRFCWNENTNKQSQKTPLFACGQRSHWYSK